jgi:UDP-N-acetylmuramoyl-tripeptide--D-alanyl-D-alanine ligase
MEEVTETMTVAGLTAAEIAGWSGGTVTAAGEAAAAGVSVDTRTLRAGDLYVAIRGERFDGHDFLETAFAGGAWGAVVAQRTWDAMPAQLRERLARKGAVISCVDTERALGDIAAGYRRRLGLKVVAVTGSNGKTTTKEMTAEVAAQSMKVHRTRGNLNNQIGLPLSILGAGADDEAAVLEMGMNHRGEIARLAEIAAPDIGVVTNIGSAHLEHLGSVEAVAEAKAELLAGMKDGGTAVLNADDAMLPVLERFLKTDCVTFGLGEGADFRAEEVTPAGGGTVFRLVTPAGTAHVEMPFTGEHNVRNALAAAAAGALLGSGPEQAAAGLARAKPPAMRFMVQTFRRGITVVNDAYNANPDSMRAALSSFDLIPGRGRRAAVLGDMLELGEHAAEAHRLLGAAAALKSLDLLVAVGSHGREIAAGAGAAGLDRTRIVVAADASGAAEALGAWLGDGDLVLLKASRGVGLEKVLEELLLAGHLKRTED